MQKKQSKTTQKLGADDISDIVSSVEDSTPLPKGQHCEPKHVCDDKFECKGDDAFTCNGGHSIVDKK